MKNNQIILIVLSLLGILLISYILISGGTDFLNFKNKPASLEKEEVLVKDNRETSSSSSIFVKNEKERIPPSSRAERIPTRYACVGEYCDGSMSGEEEKYTVIQLPFIKEGGEIGCGVGIFYGKDTVPKTSAVLDATYQRLFDIKQWPEIETDGFRNTVAAFAYLYYDRVTLENGLAKVYLSGQVTSPGTCAEPELKAQIEAVAFQFRSVQKLEVYLNNQLFDWCLFDVSGGAGSCPEQPKYWRVTR